MGSLHLEPFHTGRGSQAKPPRVCSEVKPIVIDEAYSQALDCSHKNRLHSFKGQSRVLKVGMQESFPFRVLSGEGSCLVPSPPSSSASQALVLSTPCLEVLQRPHVTQGFGARITTTLVGVEGCQCRTSPAAVLQGQLPLLCLPASVST